MWNFSAVATLFLLDEPEIAVIATPGRVSVFTASTNVSVIPFQIVNKCFYETWKSIEFHWSFVGSVRQVHWVFVILVLGA